MERPFRTPLGLGVGILAMGLSVAIGALYLPGMTAALVWPYEWAIFGVWWLIGLVFFFKVRPVGPGPDAGKLLLESRSR